MAFFQKVQFVFQISKYPKKIIPKTILNLKFKFQAHDSFLEYFFGDLKKESHFLKKATFGKQQTHCTTYLIIAAHNRHK